MRNDSDDEAIYEGIAADDIVHNRDQRLLQGGAVREESEDEDEYYDEEEDSAEYDEEYCSEESSEEDEAIAPADAVRSSQVVLDDEVQAVN